MLSRHGMDATTGRGEKKFDTMDVIMGTRAESEGKG